MWVGALFLTLLSFVDLEGKMAEVTLTADALRRTLDAEATKHTTLGVVVASVCDGLGVKAG
jgi:hypothetical protein